MSFLLEDEKYGNFGHVTRAPPIRKLFSSAATDDEETNNVNEIDTFKVFLRIKPNSKIDNSVRSTF